LEKFEMKKTLVAIAAVVATTGAMAEATITGLFDAAINTGTATTLGSGPNGGSEVTVGISEDLGNGLKGTAALTIIGSITSMNDVNTDGTNGMGFGMYQSHIGIEGDFGSIKAGAQWSPIFLASTISDITGRWNSSSLANPGELQNFNSVTYTSPSISGFTLSYQAQLTDSSATPTDTYFNHNETGAHATAYSLTYTNGGLSAAYANSTDTYYKSSSVFTAGDVKSTLIAASYDFGVAKVHYGHLVTNIADGATDVTSNSYGVTVPVGAFILGAQNSSDDSGNTTNSYIANYSMSKKTTVYFANTDASGTKTNQLGIKMAF